MAKADSTQKNNACTSKTGIKFTNNSLAALLIRLIKSHTITDNFEATIKLQWLLSHLEVTLSEM